MTTRSPRPFLAVALLAAFAASLTACGGGALTQAGAQVTLNKADPPKGCVEKGGVSGYTIGPDYQERNKNKLRNEAAEKGANYVRLEQNDSDGNASGTAYSCPR
ncbi:MAG: DUF4156 domain-containing protein [Deltaproteobacteria bacterium]|nr:DUF4156 domain-containing protein [Deltaproteobacteria bacterium]